MPQRALNRPQRTAGRGVVAGRVPDRASPASVERVQRIECAARAVGQTPTEVACAVGDALGHVAGEVAHPLSDITHETGRSLQTIAQTIGGHVDHAHGPNPSLLELIIIDESERLTGNAIEWLRDQYDRTGIAMILIGMPGIEKQFTHYPQLYSRLGFAHQYRPLGHDELLFVLERQWRKLGKTLDPDDFTDAQAIAAVERITRGNFRLLERLLPQIQRVLKINELDVITNDVVEAARSTLVIGTT